MTGQGGHSWWNRGRPSAVHELVRLLHAMIASATEQLPVNVGLVDGGTGVNAIAARASATVEWRATDQAALAAGIPVALGCCEGEDMHAPTERIRADTIATGAEQLRAVLTEILERSQEC